MKSCIPSLKSSCLYKINKLTESFKTGNSKLKKFKKNLTGSFKANESFKPNNFLDLSFASERSSFFQKLFYFFQKIFINIFK